MPRYRKILHSHKADGSLVTDADLAVQQVIQGQLADIYPGALFLGEEMGVAEQQGLMASG